MKKIGLGLGLLFAASVSNAQTLEVGTGDWSEIPEIEARGNMQRLGRVGNLMHELAEQEVCDVRGLSKSRIELSVPFLIQFGAEGSVERIVLRDTGCRELESLLGGFVLGMARAGEYRPTGENSTGWYRSKLSFVSQ